MISLTLCLALHLTAQSPRRPEPEPKPKPSAHEKANIEGWTIHIDRRLRSGASESLGKQALGLLESHLRVVAATLPKDKLERLKQVEIQIDLTHGTLFSPQYHPSPAWLKDHGYSEDLAKRVHIPDAKYFVQPRFQHDQPSAVLHELSHAYHDQVLQFNNPEIRQLWESIKQSGRFDSVLHINGRNQRHYALTNPQEFFAEMSESFLGHNDFYPFNAGELKKTEPEIHAMLEKIWGRTP